MSLPSKNSLATKSNGHFQFDKETDIQVQKAQRVPNKMDPKMTTQRHIIIKMPKVKGKERILKAAKASRQCLQRSSHKTVS